MRQCTGGDCIITGVEYDSRSVTAGNVFFALAGFHVQGADFIQDAVRRGAAGVVYQDGDVCIPEGICAVQVSNVRAALSACSAAFYDYPADDMTVIGVTGTEGKSSTVAFIFDLLQALHQKAGFFSTVSYSFGDAVIKNPAHETTPQAPMVHKRLAQMRDNGCRFAVIEASSHGLSPRTARLADVEFHVGVCINVTHEHLEFHGSFEQYRDDKANLFRSVGRTAGRDISAFAVMTAADPSYAYFAAAAQPAPVYPLYTDCPAVISHEGLYPADIQEKPDSLSFHLIEAIQKNDGIHTQRHVIQAPIAGRFNVQNITAAIQVVSRLLSCSVATVAAAVPQLKPVTGRMYALNEGQNFRVFIDYAHTPSSFLAVLPPIQKNAQTQGGKVITVFGSGGERDIKKRAEQGRIADIYSDIVILTNEDPRNEPPLDILEMIAQGCTKKKRGQTLFLIPDRRSAIKHAFSQAAAGDTVLLLGKGHENSIIYQTHEQPYNEEQTARALLHEQNNTP